MDIKKHEIELAMKMMAYAMLESDSAKDMTIKDVKYHMSIFFRQEIMDEVQRRLDQSANG